jgi:hypothetical protein
MIGLAELITGFAVLAGVLLGAIKWLLAREFNKRDSDLMEAKRKWELEMSGIKDGMRVKEQDARDGRSVLHKKIEDLDEKVQRDYVRNPTADRIFVTLDAMNEKMDRLLARD